MVRSLTLRYPVLQFSDTDYDLEEPDSMTEVILDHLKKPFKRIVFAHIHADRLHWVLFDYNLSAPRNQAIKAINSLSTQIDIDVRRLMIIADFFRADRPTLMVGLHLHSVSLGSEG